jgi:uncharacterized membrane protein YdjX (TVP38/TMEM64 family)
LNRTRRQQRIDRALLAGALPLALWAVWSYATSGVVHAIIETAGDSDRSVEAVRRALEPAGAFAPVVYVLAVIVEVLVAPIPGTLLYAPAGALFGGWWGGTLSLIGNVIGAAVATWLAARFRDRIPSLVDGPNLQSLMERIRRRGAVVVGLLRANPLTSSDLVSYAAGLVGIPVWRVAAGTLVGMAPLCYAQAHASSWLFGLLPGAGIVLVAFGVAYVVIVIAVISRVRTK